MDYTANYVEKIVKAIIGTLAIISLFILFIFSNLPTEKNTYVETTWRYGQVAYLKGSVNPVFIESETEKNYGIINLENDYLPNSFIEEDSYFWVPTYESTIITSSNIAYQGLENPDVIYKNGKVIGQISDYEKSEKLDENLSDFDMFVGLAFLVGIILIIYAIGRVFIYDFYEYDFSYLNKNHPDKAVELKMNQRDCLRFLTGTLVIYIILLIFFNFVVFRVKLNCDDIYKYALPIEYETVSVEKVTQNSNDYYVFFDENNNFVGRSPSIPTFFYPNWNATSYNIPTYRNQALLSYSANYSNDGKIYKEGKLVTADIPLTGDPSSLWFEIKSVINYEVLTTFFILLKISLTFAFLLMFITHLSKYYKYGKELKSYTEKVLKNEDLSENNANLSSSEQKEDPF